MTRKQVLLIVGGGVAAFKALDLVRLLERDGLGARTILTRAGEKFVTPLSLASLTRERVHSELFSLTEEAGMGHIELSRSADLLVVAPATADLMAKAANGLADDLASTALLATDKPVLMAPAMNVRMWRHPATVRNVERLRRFGVRFVGPEEGPMACGETGPGRMAEPAAILAAVREALAGGGGVLRGRRALVTAGPTLEPIDPVRFLSNRSSGRQGYAIAEALSRLGAEVVLVSGPVALDPPPGVERVLVETSGEMMSACEQALPADVAVLVAAVADFRPASVASRKIKKASGGAPSLELVQTPDILAALSRKGPLRPKLVVGFAAETNDLLIQARAKLRTKGCDWIVANDVSIEGVMGGVETEVVLVTPTSEEAWPRAHKAEVAVRLAAAIAKASEAWL